MKFSDILKLMYQEYNVDFCYVADHMGIPDEIVQDWEADKSRPTEEEMKKFSDLFALPLKLLDETK